MKAIPYGRQLIDETDIEEVVKVLKTNWISQGPKIREFEDAFAKYCGAKYAVAVSSGTAALHLAAKVAGLRPGLEAITTPITFLATANAIVFTGATPVFADIQYETVNIDPSEIKKLIQKKTKAILPVHFAGLPADMEEIHDIAQRHDLKVIEDACHALGAEYQGKRVGSCQYSDMTVFSFHPVKHITTGEGGCITTNNKKYYEQLLSLRNHGIHRTDAMKQKFGGWFHEMRELGFNYRITDIQCALGLRQLQKMDDFLVRRNEIAGRYDAAFSKLGEKVKLPQVSFPDRKHSWHLYLFRLNLKQCGVSRRFFFEALVSRNILTQIHYIPVSEQPFYQELLPKKSKGCLNAKRYYDEVVSLPMFPALEDDEINYVIDAVETILKEHS